MSRINELNEAQTGILNRLFWLDENDEEDNEEIESLKNELLKIRGDAYLTLEFLSGLLLESRAILEGREEVKRRAERRRKTAETAVTRIEGVCKYIMEKFEIQKMQGDNCTLTLGISPGTLEYASNFNAESLPKDCYKIEYKPLTKEIKAYIADGANFEGVSLVKRKTLRVS